MGNKKNMRIIDWIMKVPSIELKPLLARIKGTKRSTLMLVLLLVALPGVLLSLGFVHLVGTQKLYCLNCHVNQRDVTFWKKSSVHPDINCATCHDKEEGGPIYSSLHFGFSADDDLVNTKCIGCHKDDLDKQVGIDAENKKMPDKDLVRIPHEMHINELGIKCTFCHYNVFHERRPSEFATYRPMMSTCYSCHDEASTSCDSCHPAGLPERVTMDIDSGGGKVFYYPEGFGAVTFDHEIHLANDLTCGNCHDGLFKTGEKAKMTMADMYAGKGCGSCHNGKGAFSAQQCGYCHVGSASGGGDLVYKDTGMGDVKFSHANHLGMGLECNECHKALFGFKKTTGRMTMDKINAGKYCGNCHNGNRAFSADDCGGCHIMG